MIKDTELNGQSIENIICIPIEKSQKINMTKEMSETYIRLYMTSPDFDIPEAKRPFLFVLVKQRVELTFEFKITDNRLLLFICFLAETPGKAMMYLWYLQYWANLHKQPIIDFEIFGTRIFPMGFPSDGFLKKIWENQKINLVEQDMVVNMVDKFDAGISLFSNEFLKNIKDGE